MCAIGLLSCDPWEINRSEAMGSTNNVGMLTPQRVVQWKLYKTVTLGPGQLAVLQRWPICNLSFANMRKLVYVVLLQETISTGLHSRVIKK